MPSLRPLLRSSRNAVSSTVFLSLWTLAGCAHVRESNAGASDSASSRPPLMKFRVTGMHCAGCAGGLRAELTQTPGVSDVSVDYRKSRASLRCDTNQSSVAVVLKVISEAGFQGQLISR